MTTVLSSTQPCHRSNTQRIIVRVMLGFLAILASIAVLIPTATLGIAAPEEDPEDSVSWGIAPVNNEHGEQRSSFSYQVDPGDTIQDSVRVVNYGTRPLELQVYGADGLTTSTGNFDLHPADHTNAGVGAWLSAAEPTVTISPGDAEEIGFTIQVPDDVGPGDHLGGIITSQQSGQGTVALDQRLASRIVVSVSGEANAATTIDNIRVAAPLSWIPFAPIDARVIYDLKNSGNVLIRPISQVSASLGGQAQTQLNDEVNELMPTGTMTEQHELSLWPFFIHRITVDTVPYTVDGQPAETIQTTATVLVIPWGTLVVILLVVGVIIWYVVRCRRQKQAAHTTQQADVPQEADALQNTAAPDESAQQPQRGGTPPPLPKDPRPQSTDDR